MAMGMYDKRKCRKCKWRGMLGDNLGCLYALKTQQTCLVKKNGVVEDLRGSDHANCKLFKAGNPERDLKLY